MEELVMLICGDRNWTDCNLVKKFVEAVVEKTKAKKVKIVEGEAKGADTCGRIVAQTNSYNLAAYPARWDIYGRGAGPVRNKQQLEEGNPHLVVAFHDDIENSKGTLDMIKKSVLAGKPTILVSHDKIAWYGNESPAFELEKGV